MPFDFSEFLLEISGETHDSTTISFGFECFSEKLPVTKSKGDTLRHTDTMYRGEYVESANGR